MGYLLLGGLGVLGIRAKGEGAPKGPPTLRRTGHKVTAYLLERSPQQRGLRLEILSMIEILNDLIYQAPMNCGGNIVYICIYVHMICMYMYIHIHVYSQPSWSR